MFKKFFNGVINTFSEAYNTAKFLLGKGDECAEEDFEPLDDSVVENTNKT